MSDGKDASHWIKAGAEKGLAVDFLYQDKRNMYDSLDALGLPTPKRYYFEDGLPDTISSFFDGTAYLVRAIPKVKGDPRGFAIDVRSERQLRKFTQQYDPSKHTINLVAGSDILYSGCIISRSQPERKLVAELQMRSFSKPSSVLLFHGQGIPVTAAPDAFTGNMKYSSWSGELERSIIYKAIQLIGGLENPMEGYFEYHARFATGKNSAASTEQDAHQSITSVFSRRATILSRGPRNMFHVLVRGPPLWRDFFKDRHCAVELVFGNYQPPTSAYANLG